MIAARPCPSFRSPSAEAIPHRQDFRPDIVITDRACPACDAPTIKTWAYCSDCGGATLPHWDTCRTCGSHEASSWTLCQTCGHRID